MYVHVFFVFVLLFYVGTHLARGYSSGDPRNHYNTHTYSYTQHNHQQSQTIVLYTHTVWSVAELFFQVIQGCRAGFEPRTSHNFCSASSLKLPLSHPCTPKNRNKKTKKKTKTKTNVHMYAESQSCINV